MKRLVYSPKAYVFIRSRTRNQVYDVSDYVVSGRVTRNINAPSTAEFVLKNRFFQFSANKENPIFLPMDGVTIWLQRIAGKPIQVFTGYLDSVPYYQMYPGDAPFRATCTLKRLKHTYFDPGVMATMDFFTKHGWVLTPDGQATNFEQMFNPLSNTSNQSTDGGMAILLRDFLIEIAGWKDTTLMISDVPRDLPARAARLYSEIQADGEVQRAALESFLKNMITLKANNSLGRTGAPLVDNVKDIMKASQDEHVDAWLMTMAALVLSGLDPTHANDEASAPDYGYGLYSLAPTLNAPSTSGPQIGGAGDASDATADGSTIEGYTFGTSGSNTIFNPRNSVKAFIKRIRQQIPDAKLSYDWRSRPYAQSAEIIAAGSGKDIKAQVQLAIETNADLVQQYLGAATGTTHDQNAVQRETPFAYWQIDTSSTDWNVTWDNVDEYVAQPDKFTSQEKAVFNTDNWRRLRNSYNRAAAYTYVGLQSQYNLVPLKIDKTGGQTLLVMGPRRGTGNLRRGAGGNTRGFYQWAASQTTNRGVIEVWNGLYYSKNGREIGNPDNSPRDALMPGFQREDADSGADIVVIRMTDNDNPIDPPYWNGHPIFSNTATATPTEPQEQEFKFSDLLKISFASAFTTQFSFPANFMESQVLSGDRALMNDIPVLEGVDKICKASMRSYMSMPSGEFLAFYPDYFGSYGRTPYWKITDTEIVNLGINLTDDNLVTHAFVTGGTFVPGEVNFMNKALSLGVVSVEQVFNSDDFISGGAAWFVNGKKNTPGGSIILGGEAPLPVPDTGIQHQAAINGFLGIYGLRPMSVENPIIRSQVVEFLYAWQLFMYMWAAQFATRAQFTFQPEILAGGRIAFPDHNLEVYVEQVTHSWDYSSGFTTDAVIMAPKSNKKDKYPGMALASGLSGFASLNVAGGIS